MPYKRFYRAMQNAFLLMSKKCLNNSNVLYKIIINVLKSLAESST
jgi:hypothetical protein